MRDRGSTSSRWAGFRTPRREHYELHISLDVLSGKISEHLIAVRVYDRHENVGVAKTVFAQENSIDLVSQIWVPHPRRVCVFAARVGLHEVSCDSNFFWRRGT